MQGDKLSLASYSQRTQTQKTGIQRQNSSSHRKPVKCTCLDSWQTTTVTADPHTLAGRTEHLTQVNTNREPAQCPSAYWAQAKFCTRVERRLRGGSHEILSTVNLDYWQFADQIFPVLWGVGIHNQGSTVTDFIIFKREERPLNLGYLGTEKKIIIWKRTVYRKASVKSLLLRIQRVVLMIYRHH